MTVPTSSDPIDLKFLPNWLKESEGSNPYAHFRGDEGGDGRERRAPRGDRNDRPQSRDKDKRGPRRDGPKSGGGAPRGQQGFRDRQERPAPRPQQQPVVPAAVQIEFGPDDKCMASVAAEVKSTHLAYAVFGLARMFLQQPARYTVKLAAKEESSLFRLGPDGPVATTAEFLERGAFQALKDRFYKQEITEIEAPKGNFSSVARCRLSGVLLGPTNHHGYQPAMRSLFEKRFSRRMSFAEYSGRNIEMINDPAVVEEWKNQAARVVTWTTLEGAEPATFNNDNAVQAHFKEVHLPGLLQKVSSVEISGPDSIKIQDRALSAAIRDAWYQETKFPGHMVRRLTASFTNLGLHLFKHRKRFLYVSSCRPQLFEGDATAVRETVVKILALLQEHPGLQRKELAGHLLPADADADTLQKLRLELASDLHWMIVAGHVIEFQDGKLDLPLTPKAQQQQQPDQ